MYGHFIGNSVSAEILQSFQPSDDKPATRVVYKVQHQGEQVFVYKCFSGTIPPAIALATSLEYLPNCSKGYLTADEKFMYLKYKYIKGGHYPMDASQYLSILTTVNKLHDSGLVHSDIKRNNIIFGTESSFLIDFDMCSEDGTLYPVSYNHMDIFERHQEARPNLQKKKEHDRYALAQLLRKGFPEFADVCNMLNNPLYSLEQIMKLFQSLLVKK